MISRPVRVLSIVVMTATGAVSLQAQVCSLALGQPRVVTIGDSITLYSEVPQSSPTSRGIALIGDPTFGWTRTGANHRVRIAAGQAAEALAGIEMPWRGAPLLIPAPRGATRLHAPHALPDGNGAVQVVWGSSADTSRHPPRPDTIWYARWYGGNWTDRELIGELGNALWARGGTVGLTAVDGDLVVAVAPSPTAQAHELSLFRRTGGSWSRGRVTTAGFPLYVTLANAGTRILLAFVSSTNVMDRLNRTALFTAYSDDRGATWSPATRVAASGSGVFLNPRIVSPGPDRYALLWSYARQAVAPESLLLALSSDRGDSWAPGTSTAVPGGFGAFDVVTASHGSLYIVLGGPTGAGLLSTAIYANGRLSTRTSRAKTVSLPTVAWEPRYGAWAFWGTMLGIEGDSAPALSTARLDERGCRRPR